MPKTVGSKSDRFNKPYLLRGYLKLLPNGKWLGVCLTLNLVVEAESRERVRDKLESLVAAYVEDAVENNEVDEFIPRRAPFRFYAEYAKLVAESILGGLGQSFATFSEALPLQKHA